MAYKRTAEMRARSRAIALAMPRANGQFAKADSAKSRATDLVAVDERLAAGNKAQTTAVLTDKIAVRRNGKLNRKTLVARVSTSIERELFAVERLLADNGEASTLDAETERRARTLASLARTLRELSQLEQAKTKPKADDNDAIPRDLDELRRELARRLDALIADAKATYPDPSGVAVDGTAN